MKENRENKTLNKTKKKCKDQEVQVITLPVLCKRNTEGKQGI